MADVVVVCAYFPFLLTKELVVLWLQLQNAIVASKDKMLERNENVGMHHDSN